jgi:peroxiredoxin
MLPNSEGKRVPQVTFRTRQDGQWKDVTTDESSRAAPWWCSRCPAPITPTCSSTHLPRYNELAPTLRKHGVDDIVCVSVNDAS